MYLLRLPIQVQLKCIQARAKDSQRHALLQAEITIETRGMRETMLIEKNFLSVRLE